MFRILPLFVCFALLHAASAAAQSAGDLRGSADAASSQNAVNGSNDAASSSAANPAQSNVFSLRNRLNSAAAETGSSGLGTNGRVTPVRPFSDRIAAVRRAVPVSGAGNNDEIFTGDTSFDAAEGIRLGSFTLIPQLTISSGWTDNTSQSAGGEAGSRYDIETDISLTSGWSRHQLDAALRGTYLGYPSNSDDDDMSLFAATSLRLDISDATQVTSTLSYSYTKEEDGSAESSASGTDHEQIISGQLNARRSVGLVAATASVGFDRNSFTSDTGDESGRDNTLYSASLRLDGNSNSIVSPFVASSMLLRRFDQSCSEKICEKRDATGFDLRGGVTIASGPKVTGEIGVGWRVEKLEDSQLEDLSGLVVDGSLVWSPTRLTTVMAGLGTSFSATDIDGASGSIIYSGDLRVAHAFSDRLVGEAGLGYSHRVYEGVDIEENTMTGVAGMTFALTQNAAITAEYTHRRFDSSNDGADYSENAIEAGIRFRH